MFDELRGPDGLVLAGGQHVEVLLSLEVVVAQSGVVPLDHHGVGDVKYLVDLVNLEDGVHDEGHVNGETGLAAEGGRTDVLVV